MKRVLILIALAVEACSSAPAQIPADLTSPQALTISGDELFVASTGNDELRVVDFNSDGGLPLMIPAPDPIYVLSIPVAPKPIALAADKSGTTYGSYVFSLSAVARRLSIVSVPDKKELVQVALPGTPLSVVARTLADGGARAYVGLDIANSGAIATVDVPPLEQLRANPSPPAAVVQYQLGDAVPAGIDISPDGHTMAVGDRRADESSPDVAQRRGGLLVLNLDTGEMHRVLMGGPVGRVRFSPEAFSDGGTIAAGDYLYAIVEGNGCPLGERCGGIQIVHDLAHDGGALQASPGTGPEAIRLPGVATDIAIAAGTPNVGQVTVPQAEQNSFPLMLAVPSSTGSIYYVDGVGGRLLNSNFGVDAGSFNSLVHLNPDGTTDSTTSAGPSNIKVGLGGIEDQTVLVTYQGPLPVLVERPVSISNGQLVDLEAEFARLGVMAGDEVDFGGLNAGCPTTANVASADGGVTLGRLTLDPAIPDGCVPAGGGATYTIRGGGAEPYVVAGLVSGLLGRVGANQSFASTVPYYFHAPTYDPSANVPALSFDMGAGDPRRGAGYAFQVTAGVSLISTTHNRDSTTFSGNAIAPGPVVWSVSLGSFVVAYAGANGGGLLDFISPSALLSGGVVSSIQ